MLYNPVALNDLEARWRSLSDDEESVAGALIDDAWALLNLLAPNVAVVDDDSTAAAVIIATICAAVKRVMLNPTGNKSESIDDYSFTRDASTATGALWFTDDELAAVRGAPTARAVSSRFSNTSTFF